MAQSSILGRIGQLVRANVNAILDSAEDPERMLDQLVRDFTDNISEAEEAVAQTIGNLRLVEDDAREAREAVSEWGSKAAAASRRADELRGQGNASEADRFDQLAKIALHRASKATSPRSSRTASTSSAAGARNSFRSATSS
jgi:phage shock protein A